MTCSGTLSLQDLSLPRESIYAAMGYGDVLPDDRVRDLTETVLEEALPLARPQYGRRTGLGFLGARIHFCRQPDPGGLLPDGGGAEGPFRKEGQKRNGARP